MRSEAIRLCRPNHKMRRRRFSAKTILICKCPAHGSKSWRSCRCLRCHDQWHKLEASLQGLRKGEDDDRWRARIAEEGRNRAGGRGGILLSVERVGDYAAADAAAGIKAVEHLSGVCVQRKEVVVEIAGEQHPAGGRREGGEERR